MTQINYSELNSRAVNLLLSVKKHVNSIDEKLKALVELRVSQINGCGYCVDLHSREAKKAGETQQRIDCVVVWRESGLFSPQEMSVLQWSEAITLISEEEHIDEKLGELLAHYSETEAVDLSIIISVMNSLNRLAIGFGEKPEIR